MKQVTLANCDGAGLELPPLWFELRIFRLPGKGGYYTRPLGTMHQFTDNVGCNYMLHPSQNSNILCTRICTKQAICPRGQLYEGVEFNDSKITINVPLFKKLLDIGPKVS